MSEVKWHEVGGVWRVEGWPYRDSDPTVQDLGEVWGWCVTIGLGIHTAPTLETAQIAAMEAALALVRTAVDGAEALLAKTRRAAQDADDAALVAAHGEVVWAVGLAGAGDLHTATIAGHPCYLEDRGDQGVKWWLDPEYYGHPHTWYAPDLETAKSRAAAAALRTPCKRWLVEIHAQGDGWREVKGGIAEVWAVTSEGAMYRAAVALGARMMGGRKVEGKATEVAR